VISSPSGEGSLVRLGADGGQTYGVGSRATVGRLDSADIPVNDKSVSREHARISRLQGTYVVEDLHSTNGTLVNGQRIDEPTVLRPGDIVTFGAIEFRFQLESPQVEPEPSGAATVIGRFAPAAPPDHTGDSDTSAVSFPPVDAFGPVDSTMSAPMDQPFSPAGPTDQTFVPAAPEPEPPSFPREAAAAQPEPEPAAWAQQLAPESPFAPPPTPAPTPPAAAPPPPLSRAGGGDAAQEALQAAERLSSLVQELASRLREAEAESGRGQETSAALDDARRRQESVRQAVASAHRGTIPSQQLSHLQETLDALAQSPRDFDLLRAVSQDAGSIATLVGEYGQMRASLDAIATAAGGSS
jgi:predicted component of type VI protein secretion system